MHPVLRLHPILHRLPHSRLLLHRYHPLHRRDLPRPGASKKQASRQIIQTRAQIFASMSARRRPKCHNEIKQEDLFTCLDDNIMSFEFGTFGVILTRRILIQALVAIGLIGLATLSWDVVHEGPSWYLEGNEPNLNLTWADFVKDCGSAYSNNISTINKQFAGKYKNVVVEWEGRVLRVDGDHGDQDEDPVLQISSEV